MGGSNWEVAANATADMSEVSRVGCGRGRIKEGCRETQTADMARDYRDGGSVVVTEHLDP